ncbi:MAG: WD40 repeat domain-containing protein, partial [Thermoguttaceae bacterium]|nr:WD40 repeat domain-containing protein [Thermoguttaceae bacterium]
ASLWALCWSHNGRWIAACSPENKSVHLWDAERRTLRQTRIYAKPPRGIAFSPDDQTLAVGGSGLLKLLAVPSLEQHLDIGGGRDEVTSIAFSPEGTKLVGGVAIGPEAVPRLGEAVSPRPNLVRFWDAKTGRLLDETAKYRDHDEEVVWLPDGKTIVSRGNWGTVCVWDAATRVERARLSLPHYVSRGFSVSSDGRTLATADRRIALWDIASGTCRHAWDTHGGLVSGLAHAPDGKTLFSAGAEGVFCWDPATGRLVGRLPGSEVGVRGLALTRDGKTLAAGARGADIQLWDVASGRTLKRLTGHRRAAVQVTAGALAFSPAGDLLVSGGADKTVRFWDVARAREIRRFDVDGEFVPQVRLSPDNKTLAVGVWDRNVRLYRFPTGEELGEVPDSNYALVPCDFVPGGPWLACVRILLESSPVVVGRATEIPCAIRVWDYERRRDNWLSHRLTLPFAVAVSHRGHLVAATTHGYESTIWLWSAKKGKLLTTLRGHAGTVQTLQFSRDDTRLTTGGQDGTLLVWDVSSVRED